MIEGLLIKNALLIDPSAGTERTGDLRIGHTSVVETGEGLAPREGEPVLDGSGLWVVPGFIDLHCHLRDLGQKDKEDIETGTRSAAAGGYTSVVCMANTDPPVDNSAILTLLIQRIRDHAKIDVLPAAAVTKGLNGTELTNMVELADLGAAVFSDDGRAIHDMAVLRRALEHVRLTGRLIISHAEDKSLAGGGLIHEGVVSTRLGLPGIPAASETVAVARELEIVRITRARYHFTHLSCAGSIELIRRAKREGLPVTADVTPHHVSLTVDDLAPYDTHYKMNPPLRTREDRDALIAGLVDGTIDAIATDHAPHTDLDKAATIYDAPFGLTGFETAFAVTYEALVSANHLSRKKYFELLTTGPARILGLPIPSLQPGPPANLAVIDPELTWTFDPAKGHSKAHNSPFAGRSLKGKVVLTIFKGTDAYADKHVISRGLSRAAAV